MTTKIYFLSPKGFAPLKKVRNLLKESHGWTWADTSNPPFPIWGVAIPADGVDAMEVVDALTAEGAAVLPSIHDPYAVPPTVSAALSQHGVLPTDSAMDCATKMHAICGMPPLRPHRY